MILRKRIALALMAGAAVTLLHPVTSAQADVQAQVEVPTVFRVAWGKDTKVANDYDVGPYTWLSGYELSPSWDTDKFRLKEGEGNGCMHYVGLEAADGYWFVNDSGNWFKVPGGSSTKIVPMADCKAAGTNRWWTLK